MCDLSIIVPVYNAEKYIRNTVKVLSTQLDVSYEIVLVDDGSKDGSPEICDALSTEYKQVNCIHVQNGGPGRARNLGIELAAGDYIAFCDSDDIPTDNMYGILVRTMLTNTCDYCMCDIYTERDGRNFGFPWKGDRLFEGNSVVNTLLASMLGNPTDDSQEIPVWGSSVRAIYKREYLMKYAIRFPENIRFAEDLVFNVRYLVHCKRVYVLERVLYRYTYNVDSIMNQFVKYNAKAFSEKLELVRYLREVIEPLEEKQMLETRLAVSARCYFQECIGNAARAIPERGYWATYLEIKGILRHPTVCGVLKNLNVKSTKKLILYKLMQKKCTGLLTVYYGIRLQKRLRAKV